ncbi:MAG: glucan 1,4-alpha-glucosidase [Chloroflexi bacterium]|nr:glucan 1,4-alpha-glucosidase [Chloroflexota bacterium]
MGLCRRASPGWSDRGTASQRGGASTTPNNTVGAHLPTRPGRTAQGHLYEVLIGAPFRRGGLATAPEPHPPLIPQEGWIVTRRVTRDYTSTATASVVRRGRGRDPERNRAEQIDDGFAARAPRDRWTAGQDAFGRPGLPPRWTTGAKIGVGTAVGGRSKVWFTLARGIVTEVYYPRVDVANLRDLQLLVSDGRTFFHEEQRDLRHTLSYLYNRALAYQIVNEAPTGRYRVVKRIFTDPEENALVQRVVVEPLVPAAVADDVYVLAAPHVGNQGADNVARCVSHHGQDFLVASRGDIFLALAASVLFHKASCGFVGSSDGWTDLAHHLTMDWTFERAAGGNVAMTAQLDLGARREFVLVLAFGLTEAEAIGTAAIVLAKDPDDLEQRYIGGWRDYCAGLEDLSRQAEDGGRLYWTSAMVLKAHEDKTHPGAFVASLSIPWGEAAGDANTGGYHLCWPRDLVQIASACLAMGDGAAALRALRYLAAIQHEDGSLPQNCWVDGRPYWRAIQCDEIALPILLAWRLWRAGLLDAAGCEAYPLVRPAALFLAKLGPVTQQERWEENGGYSPSTLAAEIAALVCAAEFATAAGEERLAAYFLEVADSWATQVEHWTFTHCGALVPGHPAHYERIATIPPKGLDHDGAECRFLVPIANQPAAPDGASQCCIVDGGFLELVRYGVRSPDDAHVLATFPVVDALLKVDTPAGPAWRRYNFDGYGEYADGSPYDGTGVGRAWPLLAGERGHYVLAARGDVAPFIRAMEGFANVGQMLPEQVWDAADIAGHGLFRGQGTGSATPLAWAHAEYIRLLRSRRAGRVFDQIEPVYRRYVGQRVRSELVIWKFNHKVREIQGDQRLRVEVGAPAELRWTHDSWTTAHHQPLEDVAPGAGIHAIEFPADVLSLGRPLEFTFYWSESGRWEGRNFVVSVVAGGG